MSFAGDLRLASLQSRARHPHRPRCGHARLIAEIAERGGGGFGASALSHPVPERPFIAGGRRHPCPCVPFSPPSPSLLAGAAVPAALAARIAVATTAAAASAGVGPDAVRLLGASFPARAVFLPRFRPAPHAVLLSIPGFPPVPSPASPLSASPPCSSSSYLSATCFRHE